MVGGDGDPTGTCAPPPMRVRKLRGTAMFGAKVTANRGDGTSCELVGVIGSCTSK